MRKLPNTPEQKTTWSMPKHIQYLLGAVTLVGALATVFSIPGMPRLFYFDHQASDRSIAKITQPTSQTILQPSAQPTVPARATQFAKNASLLARKETGLLGTGHDLKRPLPPSTANSDVPDTESKQNCAVGSVCIGRDNNGSVDINVTTLDTPKRVISDSAARKAVQELSRISPGNMLIIETVSSSEETTNFAEQLAGLFKSEGWLILMNMAVQQEFSYVPRNGRPFGWAGKGFACVLFVQDDPIARAAINAIKATGYPCNEQALESKSEAGPSAITLLVGTKGRRDD